MSDRLLIGVDIGGTKIAVGAVDATGGRGDGATEATGRRGEGTLRSGHPVTPSPRHPLAPSRRPPRLIGRVQRATAECGDGEALLEAVRGMIDAVLEAGGAPPARIGLALPGPVDRARGCLVAALTLPLLNFRDLGAYFQARYGVPVALDNDANAAALGEAYFGAASGARVMVYFTVSTGVGGGIVADGRLFRGATGNAGEFGHQTILPGGPRCACGKHGCLEALVSGPAIAARFAARREQGRGDEATEATGRKDMASSLAPSPRRLGRPVPLSRTPASPTAADIAALAVEGDPLARRVWEETGYYLGIGISHAIGSVSPEAVVLGGGVTRAGDLLLDPARRAARQHTPPHLFDAVRIVPAALGDDVGILGAVALTLEADGVP